MANKSKYIIHFSVNVECSGPYLKVERLMSEDDKGFWDIFFFNDYETILICKDEKKVYELQEYYQKLLMEQQEEENKQDIF